MQKLIPCKQAQLKSLRDDLHKMVIGDLLHHNENVAAHDEKRVGETVTFMAHETTIDEVIETIAVFISGQEFSLDVKMANDMMAIIPVRVYGPPIEGLI